MNSWKEIASYLSRSERTVRRWEEKEGLPVHRLRHEKRGSIYAYQQELDAWWDSRKERIEPGPVAPPAFEQYARRRNAAKAVGLALLVIGTGFVVWRLERPSQSDPVALHQVPLTSYVGSEIHPSFSPDDSQVAFAWDGENQDNFDIYVKVIGAGLPLRLTTNPAADVSPAWSPDGKSIAFTRQRFSSIGESSSEIFLIPALGGAERRISTAAKRPWNWDKGSLVSWSPDGQWLAFSDTANASDPPGVFLLSVATGERRQLTIPPNETVGDFFPAFSPDGRWLAFARLHGASAASVCVVALSAGYRPAGEPASLTSEKEWGASPAWAPDGRELFFVHGIRPNGETVWRISPSKGREPKQIALFSEGVLHLAISRNWKLAYARRAGRFTIRRVEMQQNEKSGKLLTPPFPSSTHDDEKAQYSPDGKRIAFVSARSGTPELWTSSADGSNLTQLTSLGGPLFGYVSWSPDGEQIAFHARPNGQADIFVVRLSGGSPKRLTDHPADDIIPTFSRDGKLIYFNSTRAGGRQIWRIPVSGGEALQVTKRGGFIAMESEDGRFLYYTKFQGGIWRMPLNGGDEECVVGAVADDSAIAIRKSMLFYASGPFQNPRPTLYALDLRNGQRRAIVDLNLPLGFGLSVSPDLRSLLYTERSQPGSDLMLVENIHR